MSELVKNFGRRLRELRIKRHLSQEKLAEICGLHPTYIGQVERGEKNCTLESLEKIARGLDLPPEMLLARLISFDEEEAAANEAYDIFIRLSEREQQRLLQIIKLITDKN